MSRSLPDVRDGLKPVHRRLIYAMHQLRLDPAAGFKKCARVVGDVMGKYPPARRRLDLRRAWCAWRRISPRAIPLVEGQGNFGNIDGDNPAAMRYTEARLTEVAQALLAGIDDDAVDFRPTYDGEESEPVVLPGGFPNLLANGAAGIAVGMATSIPPHNAGEVCAAAIPAGAQPGRRPRRTCWRSCPAPISPPAACWSRTRAAIAAAYETGRGGFRVRAQVGGGARQARHLDGRRHRNPVPGAEGEADRADRAAAGGEEAAAARRRARREHRGRAARAGAEVAQRRAGSADGDAVPRDRAGNPLPAQHERAGRRPHAAGDGPARGAARTGSTTATRCWCAAPATAWRRSSGGWRSSTASCWSSSTSTRSSASSATRTSRSPALMAAFSLTEVQAEAILNMRLRSLRRLEEMEIRKEHKALTKERARPADAARHESRRAGSGSRASSMQTREEFGGGRARRATHADLRARRPQSPCPSRRSSSASRSP